MRLLAVNSYDKDLEVMRWSRERGRFLPNYEFRVVTNGPTSSFDGVNRSSVIKVPYEEYDRHEEGQLGFRRQIRAIRPPEDCEFIAFVSAKTWMKDPSAIDRIIDRTIASGHEAAFIQRPGFHNGQLIFFFVMAASRWEEFAENLSMDPMMWSDVVLTQTADKIGLKYRQIPGECKCGTDGNGAWYRVEYLDDHEGPMIICEPGHEHWRDRQRPLIEIEPVAMPRAQIISPRSFNSLEVDPIYGTIVKRSSSVGRAKLIDEINYLRLLPDRLRTLFPRIASYSAGWNDAMMELEYYPYGTLAAEYVSGRRSPQEWATAWQRLGAVLGELRNETRPAIPEHRHAMYVEKTERRFLDYGQDPELRRVADLDWVEVNGRRVPGWREARPHVEERIRELANVSFSVIHGDLCLSNVLYDWESGVLRLIDPRGSFGQAGIHGDPRYDVAKLWHSVHGGYDMIVADLFDLDVEGSIARLNVTRPTNRDAIRELLERHLMASFDVREVTLITGLLFVSMVPLHAEHPRRQLAMYLRGLELIAESA